MAIADILAEIDREIERLKEARALLSGSARKQTVAKATAAAKTSNSPRKKRNLSPEGRKRIAEAVKRRWENQRKSSKNSK